MTVAGKRDGWFRREKKHSYSQKVGKKEKRQRRSQESNQIKVLLRKQAEQENARGT